eukprot:1468399-Amphidinium_carterae.1
MFGAPGEFSLSTGNRRICDDKVVYDRIWHLVVVTAGELGLTGMGYRTPPLSFVPLISRDA